MSYAPQIWLDNVTPVDAAHMNHIEAGIAAVEAEIPPSLPAVVNGKWIKGVGGAAVWSAITPADVANIPYGTSLPASPYDGQEAVLVDSVTVPTYQWRFRYNASNTSAYKWEFVGGAPFIAHEETDISTITAPGLAGPVFTVPRVGYYILKHLSFAYTTGAITDFISGQFAAYPGGGALTAGIPTPNVGFGQLNAAVEFIHEYQYLVATAGQQATFSFTVASAAVHDRQRVQTMLPIRVA